MALKAVSSLILASLLFWATTIQAEECPGCQPVEFIRLPIVIPAGVVQLSIQGYQQESPVLGVELDETTGEFVTLVYQSPDQLYGAYTREPAFITGIDTTADFFSAVTDRARNDKGIEFVRKSMDIDGAELVRINRSNVTIYWFKTENPLNQKAYFVKEGQAGAYQLAGPFSEQFFQTFISRL